MQPLGDVERNWAVAFLDTDKRRSASWQRRTGTGLRFRKGPAEIGINPHHFSGGLHFGPQQDVNTGKFVERKHRLFDGKMSWYGGRDESEAVEAFTQHRLHGQLGQWNSDRLADKRHGS